MKISDKLVKKMTAIRHKHFANDNISNYMAVGDLQDIENEVAEAFQGVLKALIINTEDDHNSKDTARRVAKMFVHELFRGR